MPDNHHRLSLFSKQCVFDDPSFWGILAGNLFSIVMAVKQGWNLGEIMWVYWAQSVVIGLVNFYRILTLKSFSGDKDEPFGAHATKIQGAVFFLFHYGFFHFVYAVFLWERLALNSVGTDRLFFLLLCAAGFAATHGYSFLHNRVHDFKDKKPRLNTIMFYPYLRILPMHLTIIFGGLIEGFGLLIFMILKTVADTGMHITEHALFQKKK